MHCISKIEFIIFQIGFVWKKKTWHLYFVRESLFVYENHITQIDSISLVHAMVQHIKNSFDHFSDDSFCKEIGTIQILHLYFLGAAICIISFYVRKSHFTNWFNFIGACCIIPMVLRKPACSKLNAIFTLFCIYFPQIVWLTLDPKFLLQIWWHDFPSVCINIPDALQDISCYEYRTSTIITRSWI